MANDTIAKGIDARLVLCSAYGFSRDEDRARMVANEIMDTDPAFRLSEYAENLPYKSPEMRERLINALREAGLPA